MALPSIGEVIALNDSAMVVTSYEVRHYGKVPEITIRGAYLADGIATAVRTPAERQTRPEQYSGRFLRSIQLSS